MNNLEEKVADLAVEEVKPKEERSPEGEMTALIYDTGMLGHYNELDPRHPEIPERISLTWSLLASRGITARCVVLKSREASKEEVELVHDPVHYNRLSKTVGQSREELYQTSLCYSSIFINNLTFQAAKLAAGCVLEMTERVVLGKVRNGFALVRPPGHHAEREASMGFCHFNNVAIAAKYAVEKLGLNRVLIVDWDIHHGNGIQHMFYNDKRVLYFSLHRYDNGLFYPGQPDANYSYAGGQSALGYNVNVAWNLDSMGDAEYLSAFHHLLMPIAYEFKPELVLVSCGFDAAEGDPLGRYQITPTGYAHLTHLLMGLANGKLVIALEGGYSLSAIRESTAAIATVLLGDQPLPQFDEPLSPCESAIKSICCTGLAHAQYWESMKFFAEIPDHSSPEADKVEPQLQLEEGEAFRRGGPHRSIEEVMPSKDNDDSKSTSTEASGASVATTTGPVKATQAQVNIVAALEQEGHSTMYAVTPKPWCEHLDSYVKPLPSQGIIATSTCETCGEEQEPWVCLECYHVFCGRYINGHMLVHEQSTNHKVALSLADLSVWCFGCDSYVHNEVLLRAKNSAHESKFGSSMDGAK